MTWYWEGRSIRLTARELAQRERTVTALTDLRQCHLGDFGRGAVR